MSIIRKHLTGRVALFGAVVALAAASGCGETGVSAPLAPGSIAAVGSDTRIGVAGQPLASPVSVLVRGIDNEPLPRAQVTFVASGAGASVSPATAVTDENGIATTQWTLSTAAGPSTLTVTAGGATTTITATGTAGAAASVAVAAGNNQTAAAGAAVPTPPSVRVLDAHGNPVPNAAVTFSVLTGGGSLTDFARTTNAQGIATLGAWVLGPSAGQQTLTARVEQVGVTNNPLIFTATATAGGAASITPLSATTQSGAAGSAVTPPSVRVTDANGNPVPGVTVTFAVTAGGGVLTGATQTTNAQGVATVGGWTLGNTAGTNTVTASATGAGAVTFTATGTAGNATQLVATAGNNQSAEINRPVAVAPTVVARDAFGNPVAGVVVNFTATSGGGTVIAGRQTTDATGAATVGAWFLGATPGANTLTASAQGLTSVVFTATATPGTAFSMAPASAIVQTGTVNTPVADPPAVVVRDLTGNPVPGVVVTFTVTAGAGTIAGTPATTNAQGIAQLTSWTLGPLVTSNTVVASATGLPSITFTATPNAGAPANVVLVTGDGNYALQGTAVSPRPTVRVTDGSGNPVASAVVTFAATAGGGTVAGGTQLTDAAGLATVGNWVLGTGAPNTLTATVTGNNIVGNPVTFTAHAASVIAITNAPAGPLLRGDDFTITAQLRDALGNPILLAGIQLTLSSSAPTLNGTTTVSTDANGTATFTVNVTGAAGARTFTVSGTGLTAATTAAITFN